ncbi:D-hexose-6-phosphate mutarotase [Massilia sp. MB5]|uniref:D-hexose-6-phosphate mutarotase n=1 Tax=Massilia sp. MB5 TaxID=2919578 RepID=UPI001F0D2397|nr:D-hexose-6-phosphate mutarotase [Massilia sp. MB5]UMR31094.1 D-hexose-6-phosphate mutarotase [Massilia sp. MB5]
MSNMEQAGRLPAVRIKAQDGSQALIALYGAHLLSWKNGADKERLFLSARSALDGSAAIRGGVPVIFPQFGQRGNGQRHGFARTATWRLASHADGQPGIPAHAEFHLNQDDLAPAVKADWPYAFELRLRFTLRADALSMAFNVRNTGLDDFSFAAALHTYYALADFASTTLDGLAAPIAFSEFLDEIHPATPTLSLRQPAGHESLQLQQQGFNEWVVWNPGAANAAALLDMADEEWRRFVCIEPARVDKQILRAGGEWSGIHTVSSIP